MLLLFLLLVLRFLCRRIGHELFEGHVISLVVGVTLGLKRISMKNTSLGKDGSYLRIDIASNYHGMSSLNALLQFDLLVAQHLITDVAEDALNLEFATTPGGRE